MSNNPPELPDLPDQPEETGPAETPEQPEETALPDSHEPPEESLLPDSPEQSEDAELRETPDQPKESALPETPELPEYAEPLSPQPPLAASHEALSTETSVDGAPPVQPPPVQPPPAWQPPVESPPQHWQSPAQQDLPPMPPPSQNPKQSEPPLPQQYSPHPEHVQQPQYTQPDPEQSQYSQQQPAQNAQQQQAGYLPPVPPPLVAQYPPVPGGWQPRPPAEGKIWLGILIGAGVPILGYLLAFWSDSGGLSDLSFALVALPFWLMVILAIVLTVMRSHRRTGIGMWIGLAALPIIGLGACVVMLFSMAGSL